MLFRGWFGSDNIPARLVTLALPVSAPCFFLREQELAAEFAGLRFRVSGNGVEAGCLGNFLWRGAAATARELRIEALAAKGLDVRPSNARDVERRVDDPQRAYSSHST